jgi:PPP family 3-phenylpropionic acid transporter
MDKISKELTIKYAFLQSTFWISQCIICSFAAVYLTHKGFSTTTIGIILSLASVLSVILQPLIASYADKSTKIALRTIVLLLMIVVFLLTIALCLFPNVPSLIAIIFVLINAIQCTLIPLFNSLAILYMNKGILLNYGLARGISSLSYAFMSSFVGIILSRFSPNILIYIFLFTYILHIISICNYKISKKNRWIYENHLDKLSQEKIEATLHNETFNKNPLSMLGFIKKYNKFILLLIGCSMLFFSHSLLNTYLIHIVKNIGGNNRDMGITLSISAALELPTMAVFVYLLRKVKCTTLLKTSAFFFFIKAGVTFLAQDIITLYFAGTLQMLAFALFTPASVYYVNSIIREEDKVKGQSLLGVAILGIAGTLANISGGKIIDTMNVSYMLLIGTIIAGIGFLFVCLFTENVDEITKPS